MSQSTTDDALFDTYRWFMSAIPEPDEMRLQVQLGVHFEEVTEMLQTLTGTDIETDTLRANAEQALHAFAEHLKDKSVKKIELLGEDRKEFLDSCCDQIVTVVGSAYLGGFMLLSAMKEVNRSNFSKFDEHGDPIFNENGKIMKGPLYTPPNLDDFL